VRSGKWRAAAANLPAHLAGVLVVDNLEAAVTAILA